MRRPLRLGVACALLATLALGVSARGASACTCFVAPEEVEEYRQRVEAREVAFTGTVVGRRGPGYTEPLASTLQHVTWTVAVDRVLKGVAAQRQEVQSAYDRTSCGYVFELGRRYLIHAVREGDVLLTGQCSGNSGEDEALLPATGLPGASGAWRVLALGASIAWLGLALRPRRQGRVLGRAWGTPNEPRRGKGTDRQGACGACRSRRSRRSGWEDVFPW